MAGLALESIKIEVLLNGKKALMGLKEFNKKIKGLNKPVKSVNNMFGKMFKLAGFAGFAKMAFDAQKLGRELGLISDKTGIAASKISKMQSAFSATGGDAKSLSRVITNITSGLARLSMGDASMASKLSAMGINAWEDGRVKKADVILGDIAEWTKAQLDAGRSMAEVSQFLQDTFGIEQDLANQLALGKEGFKEYQEQMAKIVGTLSEDEIDNLKTLNTSLHRLKQTVTVLTQKLVAGVGPALEFIIDVFQVAFKTLQPVLDYLVDSLKDIGLSTDDVKDAFTGLVTFLEWVGIVLKGLVDVLKGLLTAIVMSIKAFWQAVNWMVDAIKESVNWILNKLGLGKVDDHFSKSEQEKKILELYRNGNIDAQQARIALGQIGLYSEEEVEKNRILKRRELESRPETKIEKAFKDEYMPTLAEIRLGENGWEYIPSTTIVIDNTTNINATGDVDVPAIESAVDDSNSNMVGALGKTITNTN